MVKYSLKALTDALRISDIENVKALVVHSSLFSLGMPVDVSTQTLTEVIFQSLKQLNVENIVVPTFNFDFCRGVAYNRQKTPSKIMGAFSEYIRCLVESERSFHPIQSVSVNGSLSGQIIGSDTQSAFDENGPWDVLEKLNGKILLLGSDFNSASIVHLVEQRLNVPYRFWKSFSGEYIDNDIVSNRKYKMFVRKEVNEPVMNFSHLKVILDEEKKLSKTKIGGGEIYSFYISDLIDTVTNKILFNPFYFVANHKDFLRD